MMTSLMRRFVQDDSGQTTVEWVILAASMAIIAMWIVATVGPKIQDIINQMLDQLGG